MPPSTTLDRVRLGFVVGVSTALLALSPRTAASQSPSGTTTATADPASTVTFSTFLGGGATDLVRDFFVDASGNAYLVGHAPSDTFAGLDSDESWFVVKVTPGGALVYAVFPALGQLWGVAADDAGNAYMTGSAPEDYPADHVIAPDGINDSAGEVAILKLDPTGNPIWTTLVRGSASDTGFGIDVDTEDQPVVSGTTSSADFPTTAGAYQPERTGDGGQPFILKLTADGSALAFSTFLGRAGEDAVTDIVLDGSGRPVFAGFTREPGLPTVNAFQPALAGERDGLVGRLDPTGSALQFLSYLGGASSDTPEAVSTTPSDGIVVFTGTASDDFPVEDALYPTRSVVAGNEAAVTALSSAGELDFSTFLGGQGAGAISHGSVDPTGRIVAAGTVSPVFSAPFQPVNPFQTTGTGGSLTGFVIELAADGQSVNLASLIGGTGADGGLLAAFLPSGDLAVTGNTRSPDFPVTQNAIQSEFGGSSDAFLTIADLDAVPPSDLIVKVMQDSLGRTPATVANTVFEIGRINQGNPQNPFVPVTSQVSDDEGLIQLDPDQFAPGDPYYVRVFPHQEPAVKSGHEEVDGWMYEVEVDNIFVTDDGTLQPDTLEDGLTTTYLGHTTIGFNLVVSIEWATQTEVGYVDGLERAFRRASNFLFDASNAQLYLNKIAIYDDKQRWDDADVRFYASNAVWPSAHPNGLRGETGGHIHFPPKHYGTPQVNADSLWSEGSPIADRHVNVTTLVHEFGHYALGVYDEYEGVLGNFLLRGTNFGVMDKQSRPDEASSEFSAYDDAPRYQLTEAFRKKGKASFEVMHDSLSATYGSVVAQMSTPARRGLRHPELIEGPNSDLLNPDWDVGAGLEFVTRLGPVRRQFRRLRVRDADGNEAKGVFVQADWPETGMSLDQGKTILWQIAPETFQEHGNIAARGIEPGAVLLTSSTGSGGDWEFNRTIWPASKGNDDEPLDIQLERISGDIRMRAIVAFGESGQLEFGLIAQDPLEGASSLTILREGVGSESIALTGGGRFAFGDIPGPLVTDARLRVETADSLGDPFFFPLDLSIIETRAGAEVSPDGDDVEVMFGEQAPERISLLSYRFPELRDGLSSVARRVSPTYMIDAFPAGAAFEADLKIYYDADSLLAADSSAVTIYRWGEGTWAPIETRVDPRPGLESARAAISETGEYAAFLDLTKSTGVGTEDEIPDRGFEIDGLQLEPNYPNPFRTSTELAFTIPDDVGLVHVSLIVYDLLGRRVAELVDADRTPGRYAVVWDAAASGSGRVSAGVYLAVLRAGDRSVARTVVVAGR